jgi:hypothetical protein
LARIGDFEHAGHEIGNACGTIPFAICTVALANNPAQLQRLQNGEDRQHQNQPGCYSHGDAMAPGILPHLICDTCRTRHNRLMVEIAADVGGQIRGCAIAARAVLLERLHGDPVEIAAERVH